MSRIGKKPIVIPEKTQVTANAGTVAVKGPLGELTRVFRTDIAIVVENGTVVLKPTRKSLGFSHPVKLAIPEGLKVTTEKNTITASGMDIEKVGQFVARVRAQKKPEPYKGKGIRYDKEVIRRKEGKKAA